MSQRFHENTAPNAGPLAPPAAATSSRGEPLSQLRREVAPFHRLVLTLYARLTSSLRSWTGTALRLGPRRSLLAVALLAWSIGAVLFLRADGSVRLPMARAATPPAGEHNLALHRWGPTLHTSSYHREPYSHHHPIFLVDGRSVPDAVEKWTSAARDRAPWIEITWREPRKLSRVVIYHAGWRENPRWTAHRYRLSCLSAQGAPGAVLEVTDNQEAVASHALACAGAHGLRIDWTPNAPDDQVRVYEIEAWGE